MDLAAFVDFAARRGASDLHLEPGLPIAIRVRGELATHGAPLPRQHTTALARELLDDEQWAACLERGSADFAVDMAGRRCRVNVLRTSRGTGLAVRLLSNELITLDKLNLHPELKQLVEHAHGLVLISGPTGCGKSSTQAALIQEVNLSRTAHVITIEQPIEYDLVPIRAYIRQREVGRDTPSFSQALLDALREDPDVLMVGELREQQTMRLTLDACETGQLVLATLHSSTPTDALQRIVSAFPAEQQASVRAQLADSLVAVVCQRLVWREDIGLRVPECAILRGSTASRANIRQGEFFKLATTMQTGAREGQWTLERYRRWLDQNDNWYAPDPEAGSADLPGQGPDVPGQVTSDGSGSERQGADGPAGDSEGKPDEVYRIDAEPTSLADILEQLEDGEKG
jgi:twitching motility protein PilT